MDREEIERRLREALAGEAFRPVASAVPGFRRAMAELHGVPEDEVDVEIDGSHLTARLRTPGRIEINITSVPL